jgi:hypothetical protein
MLTIYVVSTGHFEFLNQALESVMPSNSELTVLVIETSPLDKHVREARKTTDHFGLDLLHLSEYKLPQVANYVLNITKSKYLMRLDADDWLKEHYIQIMTDFIKKNSFDMYVPSYIETNREGNPLREVSREQLLKSNLKDNPPHGACTVFKTQFLRSIGGYATKYDRQDGYYMWLKVLQHGAFACVSKAKFFYRQHGGNLTTNHRELWDVRASMLIDECFGDIVTKSYCVIPILDLDTLFGNITMQPFMGYETLLHYELSKLNIGCKLVVYGPSSLATILPSNIHHIIRTKYSSDQWSDIQSEVVGVIGIDEGYLCVKNIEFPFVNPRYIEAAVSAVHLFEANSCITVEELKRDIYHSSSNGLKMFENDKVHDENRKYKRSGGVTARRITAGSITLDTLITSLPADGISSIRVTEMKDFDDLEGLFK